MNLRGGLLFSLSVGVLLGGVFIHFGEMAKIPVVLGSLLIVILSLKEPRAGLLAAFPMLVIINPTPVTLGWEEVCFSVVLAVSGVMVLWLRRSDLLFLLLRRKLVVMAFLGGVMANFLTALYHDVSIADWVRGVAPFLFILVSVPIYLEVRHDVRFAWWVWWAAFAAAALFSWLVISFYLSEGLWNPYLYVFDNGKWVRIDPQVVETISQPVYEFRARITQLVQQATDVLLPLCYLWGGYLLLWGVGGYRALGVGAIMLATAAIVLTYTRSMMLVACGSAFILMLSAWFYDKEWRGSLALILITMASAFSVIVVFGLEDIYINRFYLLKQAVEFFAGEQSGKFGSGVGIMDANVTSRLEEYMIAFNMFLESPILGQGLGVKHDIAFATGHGDVINARVGYVHNWVFYFLMVGGSVGLFTYMLILFWPGFIVWRKWDFLRRERVLLISTTVLLASYALFFAVFRLLPFNMVLGGIWGVAFGVQHYSKRAENKICVE